MTLTFNSKIPISPCQMMPSPRSYITEATVSDLKRLPEDILIHTTYVTKCFTNNSLTNLSKTTRNLNLYEEIDADILIHGPASLEEFNNFGLGIELIKKIDINHKFCIEIPAFTKTLTKYVLDNYEPLEFVTLYLDTIIRNNFTIILDTAHLHSNGLKVEDMLYLMNKYKDNFKYLHLNGNERKQFTSDIHCPITSSNNKITHVDLLLKSLLKDKIYISESPCNNWEYWVELSKKYNLKLVNFNENLHY